MLVPHLYGQDVDRLFLSLSARRLFNDEHMLGSPWIFSFSRLPGYVSGCPACFLLG
jgi:hypothetical protein